MGWGRGSLVGVSSLPRIRVLAAVVVVAGALTPLVTGLAAHAADPVQTITVPAGATHGADSAPLRALATYRITASGTFAYGAGQADAECTTSTTSALNSVAPWVRQRYPSIFIEDPALLVASDFWDPDPTDDATDIYVDHKNIEWLPTTPSATGCNETDHTYQTIYVPIETRPVNFGVFDIAYGDNFGAVTVTIEQIADAPPFPSNARHTETVLVNSMDGTGSVTAALAANRDYLFVAHGTWIYDVSNFSNVADTECSRSPADPEYLRHRYGDDPLDVVVNGSPIEWHGFGAETQVPGMQGCNSPSHIYWERGTGHGAPVRLSIADTNYNDNAGTLSIDVYELT